MRVVERQSTLEALDAALADAVTGRGSLTFLAGEAGIGKTTLVRAFVERHPEVTALVGASDNLSTPTPIGPVLDMAERSGEITELLGRPTRHELFVGFLAHCSTPGRPMIVVFEDVHWADEATLDLLRYVGRRVAGSHAVVLATYRSDEVGSTHPLRPVLGDLATGQAVYRRTLTPLSEAAVAELAAGTGTDPVELHRRTGGNPFFVTEVLAQPDAALPVTLRDAVLARASRLEAGPRQVLDTASLVPSAVERDLLDAVLTPAAGDIDACVEAGLLQPDGPQTLAFRHELGRLAVASAVLPARRTELHRRLLAALLDRPSPPLPRVVHHADAAGDGHAVLEYAVLAAEDASDRGAPREATRHLERALAYRDLLDDEGEADLLERYVRSLGAGGTNVSGVTEIEHAVELRRRLGDPRALGRALRLLEIQYYAAGRSQEAYATNAEALELLGPLGETPELAEVMADAVSLAMLARRYDEARAMSPRSIELAEQLGEPRALAATLGALGAVEVLAGDVEAGVEHLLRGMEIALAHGLDGLASNALGNIGSGAGEVRRYDIAEPYLLRTMEFARARDYDDGWQYAQAWLARVQFETGRWQEAAASTEELLSGGLILSAITRITASTVQGRLRSRRGDPGVDAAFENAWELASTTGDLQRLWPVAAGRAEAALLDGDGDLVAPLLERSFALAADAGHPWAIGELGLLLWRADALDGERRAVVAAHGAEPYRLHLAGELSAAAAAWERIGCPYERADVLADGDEEQQLEALSVLDELGALPAAANLRRRLREAGVRSIPRGPRAATAAHPAGLTPRQAEVLDLIADGLTNAEIAEQLFISEKTAGHHVSAILAKLGASSRHEAVELARDA